MLVSTSGIAEEVAADVRPIRVTFGTGETQAAPWTDVRSLTWSELGRLLTTHDLGSKEGPCVVPATFRSGRRRMADAERIDMAMLDSDAGTTLQQIEAAIRAQGWLAIISSTHSHLTTRTTAKRGNWDEFRLAHGDAPDAAEAFLQAERSYLQEVIVGARVLTDTTGLTR